MCVQKLQESYIFVPQYAPLPLIFTCIMCVLCRNTAIGSCSTIARVGAIAAPWVALYLPKVLTLSYPSVQFVIGNVKIVVKFTLSRKLLYLKGTGIWVESHTYMQCIAPA